MLMPRVAPSASRWMAVPSSAISYSAVMSVLTCPLARDFSAVRALSLNPKVAAFRLSLFPRFHLAGLPALSQHALLASSFSIMGLIW
jgi:hypothetical protein